jgi:sialic acid synthase SpsE
MKLSQKFFNRENKSTYIIGEIGLNHNGSIDIAKKLIDVGVMAGVDAVKFQKRTVDKLAIKEILDAEDNRFPEFGKTYREVREHIEFGKDEYVELKQYSESKNLDFMVTAFDITAVDFLEDLDVQSYKLASHCLTNLDLLKYLAQRRKPTILSTGMAEWDEISRAVDIFKKYNCPLALMHCVSAYPTPLDQCNLELIAILRSRYEIPVGYSGHELGFLPSICAVAMGAQIIERHFTLDKKMIGFDHKISLEPNELAAMNAQIREVESIRGNGVKEVSDTEQITRDKYHVSMVLSSPISQGSKLDKTMIEYRNPGTGIPAKLAHEVLGKRAKQDIDKDIVLQPDWFE